MRIYQILLIVILLSVLFSTINKKKEDHITSTGNMVPQEIVLDFESMTIPELINYVAPQYGQDPALLSKIAWCESNHDINADHDGGRGKGATGLHRTTFIGWAKEMGQELDYNSRMDQIRVMAWAFSQGESKRDDWTTYRAYMNGGTYTFKQSKTGITYTSRCK